MLTGCGIHAADSMESRDSKHDKQPRARFDTVGRCKIDRLPGTICSSLIDDQFPTPIVLPFLMKVGDGRDPALQRATALYETTLIRVVMSQETVAGGIRIVVESHMTTNDIRERFDMVSNAGEL
ncbi:MAG: hypothetical protein NTAFB01_18980 [Nitrospira sp.]